jgi:hypothetical protein
MRQLSLRSLASFLSILFLWTGCNPSPPGSRLSQASYDQVSNGMSKTQVENIFGQPTKVEVKQSLVFADKDSRWEPFTIYRYEEGEIFVEITFKNDKVEKKDTNRR